MAVRDVIVVAVLLFAFGVAFLFFNKVGHDITSNLANNTQINATPEAMAVLASTGGVVDKMDYIYFGLFIGLFILNLVLCWVIGGIPFFMGLYFLLTVIFVVVSSIFKGVWLEIAARPELATSLANLPIVSHILGNLPLYIAVLGVSGMIVLFAKPYIAPEGFP